MTNHVDHVTMVDVDTAGTAPAAVPAIRHTATDVTTTCIAPAAIQVIAPKLEKPRSAHTVDRFHAAAGVTLAALGTILYLASMGCGEDLEAFIALVIGTGGAALAMHSTIPGLTLLQPVGRAALQLVRPLCWLATVLPRRAAIAVWLISAGAALLQLARTAGAPC